MRETVLIRATALDSKQVEWTFVSSRKSRHASSGKFADLAKACQFRRVVLLIPGDQVLLTQSSVPTRNRQKLLKALPFTLEENLIEDIDKLHFAIADTRSHTSQAVAVINKQTLQDWIRLFKENSIKLDAIIPDILAVPLFKGWTILNTPQTCLVRTGKFSGFFTEPENLNTLLEREFESIDIDRPKQLLLIEDTRAEAIPVLQEFAQRHHIQLKKEVLGKPLISLFGDHIDSGSSINLLQAQYNPQQRKKGQIKLWYPAIASVAACLIALITLGTLRYVSMKTEYDKLHREKVSLFKQVFPRAKREIGMRARLRARLNQLGKNQDSQQVEFLSLFGAAGDAIKNVPEFEMKSANFNNGKLIIHFTIDDTSKIDRIVNQLKRSGIQVKRGASTRSTEGYSSNLTVSVNSI
jgi:general secretion pathway protein L